jgi:iron complex transport system substrate-binding protein
MCRFGHIQAAQLRGVALALLLTGAASAQTIVRDASGRPLEVADATRIVSIGGAITEILYALGLERRIVAVDSTSSFPPQALKDKPNVGYMRQLSPEGVLGVAPSLVLASEGSGPPETVAVLQAARVPLVLVPDRFSGEGILEKIATVAAATGAPEDCLAHAVKSDLDALAQARQRVGTPRRVMFLLSFVNGRPMVAGRNTAADGYKLIGDEAIITARPDAVLAMQREGLALAAETVFAHPAFTATPAAARKAFISMGGLYLLGFGPRTALARPYPGAARLRRGDARAGVLLLDEPTASLDLRHQIDVLNAARRSAARGVAIVAILHDLNLATLFAERIVVLHGGRVAAEGAPAATITDATLAAVFGVEAAVGRTPPSGMPFVLPQAIAARSA